VDARTRAERADGWIPGAVLPAGVAEVAAGNELVVYCDCPDEASAAMLARKLTAQGLGTVRPLVGGFKAWKDAGLPVQQALTAGQVLLRPGPSRATAVANAHQDHLAGEHVYAAGK
jgi:rhodanese-related sulfurtransferase